MHEKPLAFRASLVIFLGRASRARKILVRAFILEYVFGLHIEFKKLFNFYYIWLKSILLTNTQTNTYVRVRIFQAREARPRKITNEANQQIVI